MYVCMYSVVLFQYSTLKLLTNRFMMAHNSYLISISDLVFKYLIVIRKRASRTGLRKFLSEKVNFSNVKRRTDEPAFIEINLRNENKVQ